jgi:hypothetical protein
MARSQDHPIPMTHSQPPESTPPSQGPVTALSKRAARRIIQRAFVLMGRDKALRQQIRESALTTLWIVEDWELAWTVHLHHGRFGVERRPAKHPDVTLTWATAEEFFQQAERADGTTGQVQIVPAPERRRFFQTLLRGFFTCLRRVLLNPIDDVGESLV